MWKCCSRWIMRPSPALQHYHLHTPPCLLFLSFYRKWDISDQIELRFPRGHSHVTQMKILKTPNSAHLLTTNNISCLLRLPTPTPHRCLREPPSWWWRAGRSSTMMRLLTRRMRTKRRLVSAPWTCWAAAVSLKTHAVCLTGSMQYEKLCQVSVDQSINLIKKK